MDEKQEIMGHEDFSLLGYAEDHAPEFGMGLASVIIVIVITEVLKPWIKLLMAKVNLPEKLEASALRSLTFIVCALPVSTLGFREAWQTLSNSEALLSWPNTLMIGCSMTWAGVQIAWLLIHDIKPIKALRIAFYKKVGVTDEDVRQTRELSTVSPTGGVKDDSRRDDKRGD